MKLVHILSFAKQQKKIWFLFFSNKARFQQKSSCTCLVIFGQNSVAKPLNSFKDRKRFLLSSQETFFLQIFEKLLGQWSGQPVWPRASPAQKVQDLKVILFLRLYKGYILSLLVHSDARCQCRWANIFVKCLWTLIKSPLFVHLIVS